MKQLNSFSFSFAAAVPLVHNQKHKKTTDYWLAGVFHLFSMHISSAFHLPHNPTYEYLMWHKVSCAYVRYDTMRCDAMCARMLENSKCRCDEAHALIDPLLHHDLVIFLLFLSFLSSSCFIFVNCFEWHVIPFRKNEFWRFGSFCFFSSFYLHN